MEINENLNKRRGERLRECRTRIPGMTQEKLADLCNCSVQHISLIENGKRSMTRDFAHDFAERLNVLDKYLLCETDCRNDAEKKHALLEQDFNVLAAINTLLYYCGYALEEHALYENLYTGETFLVNNINDLPDPGPSYNTNISTRDIGDDVVYEYDGELVSQTKEEFELFAKPVYKRISKTFTLYLDSKNSIELSETDRDSLTTEIVEYVDHRIRMLTLRQRQEPGT